MAETSPRSNRVPPAETKPEKGDPTTVETETAPVVVVANRPEDLPDVPKSGEVPDPRTASDTFSEGDQKGYVGRSGFDIVEGSDSTVAYVDPERIPADVTPAVQPNAGGNELLAAAQAKAPNLTAEFVKAYGLTDFELSEIASGAVPPPPAIGPAHTSDLYLTPAGWVQTAPGVSLAAHAAQQADRRR